MPVSISAFSSDVPDQKLSSAIFSSRRGPIRGVPSVATGSEEEEVVEDVLVDDIGLTQKLGAKAEVTRLDSVSGSARGIATAPPGHPARGRVCCRGRSPGSRVNAAVR